MHIIIPILFLIICLIAIRFRKQKRIVFSLFLIPLLIFLSFFGYIGYNSWYHVKPSDITFSVTQEGNTYTVTGKWDKRLDNYRFPTDFIAFDTPNNTKIKKVERNRIEDYKDLDWSYLEADVKDAFKDFKPKQNNLQVFDMETSKKFRFSFELPEDIHPKDIKVYYVHAREEPMDAVEYWFKSIPLTPQ